MGLCLNWLPRRSGARYRVLQVLARFVILCRCLAISTRVRMPSANQAGLVLEAHPITARSTVRAALQLMNCKQTHVLPVIDDQTGRVVGIVLRQALERGCLKMGHNPDECLIAHHTMREVLGAAGVPARSKPGRSVARQYQVLLDGAGYPLAILKYS